MSNVETVTETACGASAGASDSGLGVRLRQIAGIWARSQCELVVLAARFADSVEWVLDGSPSPAHWLADVADVADVETCTAREWIRIGHQLTELPVIAEAFAAGQLSYSKVRALTRVAEPDNETELVAIAMSVPAAPGQLGTALAVWFNRNTPPEEQAARQQRSRSMRWRTDPDGMVTFTLRLPPLLAGMLIAMVTTIVMRTTSRSREVGGWPSVAQQHCDALEQILTGTAGTIDTEVIVHVRADGATLDDGTPIPDSVVEAIAPESFIRALIHDTRNRPIDATGRRRHPTTRQKRVVTERDRACVDCGRRDLLEFDHIPHTTKPGTPSPKNYNSAALPATTNNTKPPEPTKDGTIIWNERRLEGVATTA